MKRKYFIPVLVCAVCLSMSGCQDSAGGQSGGDTTASALQTTEMEGTTAAAETEGSAGTGSETETAEASQTAESLEIAGTLGGTVQVGGTAENPEGTELVIDDTGKVRIDYTVNRSSVQYITSASMLPDYEELKGYDDAYFQDHALVLVIETVSSGSAKVGIDSIFVDGVNASVVLSHEMPDGMGTADMATWLLWAEVETGLECEWSVANPAIQPKAEAKS